MKLTATHDGQVKVPGEARITAELIRRLRPHATLDYGDVRNPPHSVCWVAVRGAAADWAVYVGPVEWSHERIAADGDKVFPRDFDKYGISVSAGALELYRYLKGRYHWNNGL